jgi:hypothetical protein
MNMPSRLKKYAVIACAIIVAFSGAMFVHGQTSNNVAKLRQELSARYQIVPLEDGLALVPRARGGAIRLVEIRNGVVAINGAPVTAREATERLGKDANLIIQATYLDAAAQREVARAGSAASAAPANTPDTTNEPDGAGPQRTQRHRGDLVRFGGNVTVGRDELVDGDVVAIGGSADIDGEVARQVTVVGGSLNLGSEAIVRGDVTVIGGSLNRASGARIDGKVSEVAMGGAQFPTIPRGRRIFPFRTFLPRVGSFLGTLLRVMLLIFFALIVVVLGGRFVETIADRAAAEPLRAGLAGLLAEVLFVPLLILTIVVLAVSIVGIPFLFLVPFAMVLAFVLMLVGFTGISSLVGRLLSNRFGITRGPYISVAVGVLAVVGITLVAKLIALVGGLVLGVLIPNSLAAIGYLAEYIAWTIGIGAVILTWFSARHRGTPAAAVSGPPAGAAPAH